MALRDKRRLGRAVLDGWNEQTVPVHEIGITGTVDDIDGDGLALAQAREPGAAIDKLP